MANTLQLEIVTPERKLVNERAEEVNLPGRDGYLGVLPGHAPLITELGVGEISYRTGGTTQRLAVAWGFAEVLPDKVTVLAETAERAGEIDLERARQARDRAQQAIANFRSPEELAAAQAALERAETRLRVGATRSDVANLAP